MAKAANRALKMVNLKGSD